MDRGGAVDLGGVRLRWTCDGLSADPIAALLRRLPSSPAGAPVDVSVELGPAGKVQAVDPRAEGYRQTCFFGPVLGFSRDGDFLLADGGSRVWVAPDGRSVRGWAAPEAGRTFTSTLLTIGLMRALRHFGLYHLHAAAVIDPTGAAWLIPGRSGNGKSTTTAALVAAGFHYLGDDSVLVRESGAATELIAWPVDFHLTERSLRPFPALAPALGGWIQEREAKRVLDPDQAFPGRQRLSAPGPSRVICPAITSQPTTEAVPMLPAAALSEVLHAAALIAIEGMHDVRGQMELLQRVVSQATAIQLRLGVDALTDPTRIVRCLPTSSFP
jgi:hypothetical protein